jgi:hypothetical protein
MLLSEKPVDKAPQLLAVPVLPLQSFSRMRPQGGQDLGDSLMDALNLAQSKAGADETDDFLV